VLSLTAGAHYKAVSQWMGHESYVTTLTIYADYIDETEGGKAAPLARPTAPTPTAPAEKTNVLPFRRRATG
jgi:integrase